MILIDLLSISLQKLKVLEGDQKTYAICMLRFLYWILYNNKTCNNIYKYIVYWSNYQWYQKIVWFKTKKSHPKESTRAVKLET